MSKSAFHNKLLPYGLLAPTFIILIVFLFYPAYETFRLSFYKVNPFSGAAKFAGGLHYLQWV